MGYVGGSYCNIPKAIYYLLKGDCEVWGLGFRVGQLRHQKSFRMPLSTSDFEGQISKKQKPQILVGPGWSEGRVFPSFAFFRSL